MSKLKKMISKPDLFIADMIKNKTGISLPVISKNRLPSVENVEHSKIKLISEKNTVNYNFSHINFYSKIPFIIHCGEGLNAGLNQLIPWIPVFLKSEANFLILVRNIPLFDELKKNYPWLYIAYAKRVIDIDELIQLMPDVTHVFYPSSTGNNIHLVRLNHLNHIFIGHGDSDKAASAHKALRLYDEIWTAGQAHIDRFAKSNFNTNHMTFLKVGRPHLAKVIENSKVKPERFNLLYLPTWEGIVEEANYSSIHLSGQILREVSQLISSQVVIKFHPLSGNRNQVLKNIRQQTENIILQDSIDARVLAPTIEISQEIPNNKLFICDISGVVTECLAADAPIFVFIPQDKSIVIAESEMSYQDYCYTYSNVAELLEKLAIVLDGDDYLAENRKKAINYFIGYNETIENRFINQLKSLACDNEPRYIPRLFEQL